MFLKIKIGEIFKKLQTRYFNTTSMSGRASRLVQFHSGGDDYCPMKDCEGLGENIGGNPADGIIVAWRDDVYRKSEPGEKRIYSVLLDEETGISKRNQETGEMIVASEIYLKNNGTIEINSSNELKIVVKGNVSLETQGDVNVKAQKVNIDAKTTNLGVKGQQIARLGDEVTVKITEGSSAGTYKGEITSAGVNTSI